LPCFVSNVADTKLEKSPTTSVIIRILITLPVRPKGTLYSTGPTLDANLDTL